MTIDFNYNQFMTQWLLLGPGLIDWVTGATHLGLYRNFSTIHIDDMFTPDDAWSTTTHANDYTPTDALRMPPNDVNTAATWSKANNFRLDLLFNGGNATANATPAVADPLLARVPGRTIPPQVSPIRRTSAGSTTPGTTPTSTSAVRRPNYIEAEMQQNIDLGRVGAGRRRARRSRAHLEHGSDDRPARLREPQHARTGWSLRLRQPRAGQRRRGRPAEPRRRDGRQPAEP